MGIVVSWLILSHTLTGNTTQSFFIEKCHIKVSTLMCECVDLRPRCCMHINQANIFASTVKLLNFLKTLVWKPSMQGGKSKNCTLCKNGTQSDIIYTPLDLLDRYIKHDTTDVRVNMIISFFLQAHLEIVSCHLLLNSEILSTKQ